MTGPEHYREAEKILELTSLEDHYRNYRLQAAQVHATLALAATQVDGAVMRPADRHQWLEATDPEYAAEQAAEVTP